MKKTTEKIWIISTLLFVLISQMAVSQDIIFRPLKYNQPNKKTDTGPVGYTERDPVVPWFAMVVHENVAAASTPGGTDRLKALRFGEVFWVIEEQGEHLKLAKDDRRDDFRLSSQAEIVGWVRKDNLLMWQRALSHPETRISLKGMIMNTTRAMSEGTVSYRRVQAYKDPSLQHATPYEALLFEIFYIYRYSPRHNSVLLGRRPHFSPRDHIQEGTAGPIIGWVDLDRVLEWDHRVAIEPNWNDGAVEERKKNNIKANIFDATHSSRMEHCAREFSRGVVSPECNITWEDDLWLKKEGEDFRKPGYWRRFPVMGDMGANVYEVMVMGELRGEHGSVIREDVDVQVRQTLNEIISKVRNINVVFVVDGTNSMGPYFQSVINSVERIVSIFEMNDEEHKNLKFGYTVYRDFLERDRILETRQLTNDSEAVVRALRRVEAFDLYDTDKPEAVYYGLRAAINNVLTDPNETNIIIHLGDAGNHHRDDPSHVNQSEIVDLIAEYKCYYIAFQVHRSDDHQAYIDFPHQIREIMSRASTRLYYEWVDLLGESVVSQQPLLRQVRPNLHRIENGPPMLVMSASRGQTMDLRILEDEITRAIEEIDRYSDMVVEKARELIERGQGVEIVEGDSEGMYASAYAPGVYNMLLRMNLSDEMLKNYYSRNTQFVSEGYAPSYHASLSSPLFSPVLLISINEFRRILVYLDALHQATASPGDRRQNLYNAWIELLKRHVGQRAEGDFDELTMEQASAMVFGVPMRSGMLDQIQLKDIFDESIYPNTHLNRHIQHIAFKYRELERISNTPKYRYSFISNDILYYWIDVDMLP